LHAKYKFHKINDSYTLCSDIEIIKAKFIAICKAGIQKQYNSLLFWCSCDVI